MNRLNLLVNKFYSPRLLWLVTVLALLAFALTAGAPDAGGGGSCGC